MEFKDLFIGFLLLSVLLNRNWKLFQLEDLRGIRKFILKKIMLSINKERKRKFTAINFLRKFTFAYKAACMKSFSEKFSSKHLFFRHEGGIVLICLLFSQINQFKDVQNSIRFQIEYFREWNRYRFIRKILYISFTLCQKL